MHGGVVGRNAALLLSVALLMALAVVTSAYVLFPHEVTRTVKVAPEQPKLFPLQGSRTVGVAGSTRIVCSAAGRTGDGKPLDPNGAPAPGDVYVQTCRGLALQKGPVG